MSTECERAARVSARPTASGGTPRLARNEFIARTIAASRAVGAPAARATRIDACEFAPACALEASAIASENTTKLSVRQFPGTRGLTPHRNRERGYRPLFFVQFSAAFYSYLAVCASKIPARTI